MKLKTKELILFSLLGATMFVSKLITEVLPNIHLLGLFIVSFTVVFRAKALIPIYIFVFLTGIYGGFTFWWVPYLYIWSILWLAVMLLPRKMPNKLATPVYMVVSGLFGLLYGVLYAPAQALLFGYNLEKTIAWIAAGFYFDIIHGISNFLVASLVPALVTVLKRGVRSIKQ